MDHMKVSLPQVSFDTPCSCPNPRSVLESPGLVMFRRLQLRGRDTRLFYPYATQPLRLHFAPPSPWSTAEQRIGPSFADRAVRGTPPNMVFPCTWSETQNIVWKIPVPGLGWSSPVIQGDRIWMTTATDEGRSLRALSLHRESEESPSRPGGIPSGNPGTDPHQEQPRFSHRDPGRQPCLRSLRNPWNGLPLKRWTDPLENPTRVPTRARTGRISSTVW